jgi:hypothetical protein
VSISGCCRAEGLCKRPQSSLCAVRKALGDQVEAAERRKRRSISFLSALTREQRESHTHPELAAAPEPNASTVLPPSTSSPIQHLARPGLMRFPAPLVVHYEVPVHKTSVSNLPGALLSSWISCSAARLKRLERRAPRRRIQRKTHHKHPHLGSLDLETDLRSNLTTLPRRLAVPVHSLPLLRPVRDLVLPLLLLLLPGVEVQRCERVGLGSKESTRRDYWWGAVSWRVLRASGRNGRQEEGAKGSDSEREDVGPAELTGSQRYSLGTTPNALPEGHRELTLEGGGGWACSKKRSAGIDSAEASE